MCIIIKLLTKPGCTVCERSIFILKRIKTIHPTVKLSKCDVSRLIQYHQYINDLPVILVNEEVVCKTKVRERDIINRIEQLISK
jgi:disulfide oxidoreductase YuzD